MKKAKKTPGRPYQIVSFTLLAILAGTFFTLNAKWNIASRAALIWFVFVFVDFFLIACLEFNYVKTPAGRRGLRLVQTTLMACIVLAPVSVIVPFGSGWRPYTFEAERAAIEAARAIPDDQNASLWYQAVFERFGPHPQLPPCMKDNKEIFLGGPWSKATYPEPAEWLATQSDTIDTLIQISLVPECRFLLQTRFFDKPPRHAQLKFASQVLLVSANADVATGNVEAALDKAFALMRIGDHSLQQPAAIDFLIGLAAQRMASVPARALIVEGKLNKAQLAMVAECIEPEDKWSELWAFVMEGEKLMIKNTLGSYYEVNPRGRTRVTHHLSSCLPTDDGSAGRKAGDTLAPLYLAFFLPWRPQTVGDVIDAVYAPLQEGGFNWNDMSAFEVHRTATLQRLAALRIMAGVVDSRMISKLHDIYLEQVAMERGANVLIGIRRHQIGQGEWPASLGDIASLTPAEAFVDPTNGSEFVYTLVGDSFRLYSKGKNGVDEGGKRDRETRADDILIWPLADDGENAKASEPPADTPIDTAPVE